MELTKYAAAIKAELASELAKQGSSIAEFEDALTQLHTAEGVCKVAAMAHGLHKQAFFGVDKMVDAATSLPGTALKGSVLGGTMAGLALDEMRKSMDVDEKALEQHREKVRLIQRLTHNLRLENGLQ